MRHTRRHIIASYSTLLSVLTIAVLAPNTQDGSTLRTLSSQQILGSPSMLLGNLVVPKLPTQQDRIAYRLQNRLYKTGRVTPPLSLIREAVAQRQSYLRSHVHASIKDTNGKERSKLDISLHANPLWIVPKFNLTTASYKINAERVSEFLSKIQFEGIYPPENITLTKIEERNEVFRAETSSVAKSGIQINISKTTQLLVDALDSSNEDLEIQLENVSGTITNETDEKLGDLKLIASGRSNFAGSTYARMQNVRKALRKHVNNTVVPPGETFSFNSTLDGPVTESRGWYIAKVIFEGDQLKPAAGGGICQASTTVYRAIVNAGFPVVERRAHSLYVSYYKKYGVGIDATIFPGYQDLVFTNDTEDTLLIQAYDDGYEAVVNIYGTSDGRTVDLEGPYFSTNAPDDFLVNDRKIKVNEVAWIQRVKFTDGTMKENVILSRYKELPKYVKNEFAFVD